MHTSSNQQFIIRHAKDQYHRLAHRPRIPTLKLKSISLPLCVSRDRLCACPVHVCTYIYIRAYMRDSSRPRARCMSLDCQLAVKNVRCIRWRAAIVGDSGNDRLQGSKSQSVDGLCKLFGGLPALCTPRDLVYDSTRARRGVC